MYCYHDDKQGPPDAAVSGKTKPDWVHTMKEDCALSGLVKYTLVCTTIYEANTLCLAAGHTFPCLS